MTAHLEIVEPGLHTTLQDRGRTGFQYAGVPVSGALDADSLAIANALVGNAPDEAALEVRYAGPAFRVAADRIVIAVAGATARLDIEDHDGKRTVASCRSAVVARGARVALRTLADSATAYLAVAGGFDVPAVMAARATYVRGGFGGFKGRALATGDEIPLRSNNSDAPELALAEPFDLAPRKRIRVVEGPQAGHFTADALALFESTGWKVSAQADRMGMRLEGPELAHRDGHDIVSDGIVTGAIQVPGNGLPIVLLADRQTTGGYPKIATVISADIGALGRARGGDVIRFEAVSVDEAARARRAHVKALKQALAAIAPPYDTGFNLEKLYSENLISGVCAEI